MAEELMLALGGFRFSINTAAYERFRHSTEWRWPSVDRVGRSPALQFTGPGPDTIQLEGTVFPHYRGGLRQLDAMRAEAGRGRPLLLVTGRGDVLGHWCVTTIEEGQEVFFSDGTPRKVTFQATLQRHGDDDG